MTETEQSNDAEAPSASYFARVARQGVTREAGSLLELAAEAVHHIEAGEHSAAELSLRALARQVAEVAHLNGYALALVGIAQMLEGAGE